MVTVMATESVMAMGSEKLEVASTECIRSKSTAKMLVNSNCPFPTAGVVM